MYIEGPPEGSSSADGEGDERTRSSPPVDRRHTGARREGREPLEENKVQGDRGVVCVAACCNILVSYTQM